MPRLITTEREIPTELARPMEALAGVAAKISGRIGRGPLGGPLGAEVGANSDGDTQKALDVIADMAFANALKGTGIRWYASEERDAPAELNPEGTLAIAIDPLDGSSNIDANISIGTIFGIQPALADAMETFLRPGRNLIAAGYIIYGPHTAMVVSFGTGLRTFILDRASGTFVEAAQVTAIPDTTDEYAINASNYRHWPAPIRAWVDDCLAGTEGPRGRNFNMRWIASLVAEAHRIVTRGGVFLYPADNRKGYEQGRLRLVYECAPIAFLIEAGGGKATTGTERMLDRVPEHLHARTPFVFGTASKVDLVTSYHDLPEAEVSALFGNRGLFRA